MTVGLRPNDKIAAGRLMARQKMPYFTSALIRLVPRETPGLGTMAVTKDAILLYDPATVNTWSVAQTSTVLLHEIGHLLRHHNDRAAKIAGVDQKRWNVAGDAEINDDLKAAGCEFPTKPQGVLPSTLGMPDGLTAEAYYIGSWKIQSDSDAGSKSKPNGSNTDQQGKGGQEEGDLCCGSGAGNPHPDEPQGSPDGRSEAELSAMRKQVAAAIQEHAARGRGNVPAGLKRWADGYLQPPKVRWQDKLARAVRHGAQHRPGQEDTRYDRPSHYQAAIGYGHGRPILPRTIAYLPNVLVAVDTSGSMGHTELNAAARELRGVLKALAQPVHFVACDCAVHSFKQVSRIEDAIALFTGGGGTDFVPVFDAVKKSREKFDMVIFMTDGDGRAPAVCPPGLNVVWLLVGAHRHRPCEWGTIIEVDD